MKLFLFDKSLAPNERKARAIVSLCGLAVAMVITAYGPFALFAEWSMKSVTDPASPDISGFVPAIGAAIKYASLSFGLLAAVVLLYSSGVICRFNGDGPMLPTGPAWFNKTGPLMYLPQQMVFPLAVAVIAMPVMLWLVLPLVWKAVFLAIVAFGFLTISATAWVLPWRLANMGSEPDGLLHPAE